MFPLDPKKLQGMFKQLGIKQEQIDAEEVVIKCADRNFVIKEPQVSRIKFQGQDMLQVSGKIEEVTGKAEAKEEAEATETEFSEEDVKTVMAKAAVSKGKAKEALIQSKGDLAKAILELSK